MKSLKAIADSIQLNERRLVDTERKDDVKLEWQQVALVVDRLLLVIFVTVTFAITAGILIRGRNPRAIFIPLT